MSAIALTVSIRGRLLSSTGSPAVLFQNNEPGIFLDPNDLSTLYQDTAGTTPVTTPGQSVALALDKSKGLVLGSEALTNGSFASGSTGWDVVGADATHIATFSSGTLRYQSDTTSPQLIVQQNLVLTIGKTYLVEVVVSSWVSGSIKTDSFGGNTVLATGAGTWQFRVTATATSFQITRNSTNVDLTIDNVSVRELPGNHATQSTAGSRPLYALLPSNGVRNLANGSAQPANDGFWFSSSVTSGITVTRVATGVDTDGLPYADYSVVGTATATTFPTPYNTASRTPASTGQQYTTSCTVSLVSGTPPPANCGVRLDVRGETAPSTLTEQFTSGTAVTSGDLSVSGTFVNAATNQAAAAVVIRVGIGDTVNFTVRIKALQFELGSTRTAYQFNYSNVNIAQPPYAQVGALKFDGVDDFMVTPAIDFSGTDKMTVFAGVRKLSDAARAIVAELGNNTTGSFRIEAPGSSLNNYAVASGGSLVVGTSASGFSSPISSVISGTGNISGDSVVLRVNGTQVGSNAADQGTGNYRNDIIYIGRRGGTTLPFNGYLFSLIVRGAATSAALIAQTEQWVNQRTGAY